jgi:hypothetical protein
MAKRDLPQIKFPTQPLPKPPVVEKKPDAKTPDDKPEGPIGKIGGDIGIKPSPGQGTGKIGLPPIGCFPHPPVRPDFDKFFDDKAVDAKDENGDGKLNRDEFDKGEGWVEHLTGDKFDKYDKDNDGYVNKDEYHEARESERFEQQFKPLEGEIGGHPVRTLGDAVGDAAKGVGDVVKKLF